MSGSVPVIESAYDERPTKPPRGDGTDGELILAGIIDKHSGPIVREEDQYEGRGDEHAQTVAQAHVYRLLTGRSYHELELHLKNSPRVRHYLGLDGVLDHTSFSRSWNKQFSEGTRAFLREYCTWIQDELRKLGVAEVEPFLPGDEPDHDEPLPEIPDGEIAESIEHVRDIMLGTTDFDRGPNTSYDAGEILDVGLDASRERAEFNAVLEENGHDPALKTVMNAIKNRSGSEWQDAFETINDRVLNAAKGAGMLDRPVEGYLDITIIPFYPQNSDRPDKARGNANKRGTMHGFHFATLVAHDQEHDKDLAVAVTSYTPEMKPYDLVKDLVGQAQEHCSLKSLSLDSDFATARIVQFLKNENITCTTRLKRRGERIQGVLASMTGEYDDFDNYRLKSSENNLNVPVRVVAEPDWDNADEETLQREIENNQHTFDEYGDSETHIPDVEDIPKEMWECRRPYATTQDEMSAEKTVRRYKMRWRVENSYADKKRALLGKTQSRDHGVRVFLFWLTTVLYNGWMLTRAFLRMDYPNHAPRDRPPVTLRQFIKDIVQIEFG
ncbi:transposase [Haloterrigena sp. SYSU A558-1]|uniref:Transposase n=1 Tax=Haloterrigena gelatinilytica TaxID=2741724 RepID=A0ABX2LKS0_9EURY|nr:transposase [Haloterrigena gelatinilytica]NUC75018.1 transposase [Haloterrigena gelatinilytica]